MLPIPPLPQDNADRDTALQAVRLWLAKERETLAAAFDQSNDAQAYLQGFSEVIDTLVNATGNIPGVALVATGGYGRKEMFPYSDVDILVLYGPSAKSGAYALAEQVYYTLWDCGLAVGQATRSINETLAMAHEDLTVRTNLLDARRVAGDADVFTEFAKRFREDILSAAADCNSWMPRWRSASTA